MAPRAMESGGPRDQLTVDWEIDKRRWRGYRGESLERSQRWMKKRKKRLIGTETGEEKGRAEDEEEEQRASGWVVVPALAPGTSDLAPGHGRWPGQVRSGQVWETKTKPARCHLAVWSSNRSPLLSFVVVYSSPGCPLPPHLSSSPSRLLGSGSPPAPPSYCWCRRLA